MLTVGCHNTKQEPEAWVGASRLCYHPAVYAGTFDSIHITLHHLQACGSDCSPSTNLHRAINFMALPHNTPGHAH
jgi:hypothetical protein